MKKRFLAILLVLAMVLGISTPNQAVNKATIKMVKGVKFTKVMGVENGDIEYCEGEAVVGSRILFLKMIGWDKYKIYATKDGKTYTKKDIGKVILDYEGFPKNTGFYYFRANIMENGNDAIIYGEYCINGFESKSVQFSMRTKDGVHFYNHTELPKLKYNHEGKLFRVGKKYVWCRKEFADADSVTENINKNTFIQKYQFFVSSDLDNWKEYCVPLSGKIKTDKQGDEYYAFKDAKRSYNHYSQMEAMEGDGTYLYATVTFMPYDEMWGGEPAETYIFRTRDFKHFEKVPGIGTCPKETSYKKDNYYNERIYSVENGRTYGISFTEMVDFREDSVYIGSYQLSYGKKPGDKMKKIFTFHPKKYKGKTFPYYNRITCNHDGTYFSLMFDMEKQNRLFVSKTGTGDFKEYSMAIEPGSCGKCWEDKKKGYRIMEIANKNMEDGYFQGYYGAKYLLFSKDGFAKSYKVMMPKETLDVEINGSIIVAATKDFYFYIPLSKIYKKMK